MSEVPLYRTAHKVQVRVQLRHTLPAAENCAQCEIPRPSETVQIGRKIHFRGGVFFSVENGEASVSPVGIDAFKGKPVVSSGTSHF